MKTERPSYLWIFAVLVVPILYWAVALPLMLGASAALRYLAPDLRGGGLWPPVLSMSAVAVFLYWAIYRFGLQRVAGLSRQDKWHRPLLVLIPVYLPLLMLYGNGFQGFDDAVAVLLASAHCFLIGFSEEVIFRGFLQSAFIKWFRGKQGGIVFAVLLSSASFGMMHLANCFQSIDVGPRFRVEFDAAGQSIVNALVQVVYATFFGVFFGAILLKSNKLWPLVFIHALVDFPSTLQSMTKAVADGAEKNDGSSAI
ncbi:MAG TPA: type II CAAX endopeptidase family protein [Bacteroidia bacterium]|nr:type II CAAX endopeptidase family protein [Bacteroidia bacterium]